MTTPQLGPIIPLICKHANINHEGETFSESEDVLAESQAHTWRVRRDVVQTLGMGVGMESTRGKGEDRERGEWH